MWELQAEVQYFGEAKGSFNTQKEPINCTKHFHPEKTALAELALFLPHRINWSKTEFVAFETDFRKRRSIDTFTSRVGHDRNRHFLVITRQPL